MSVFSPLVFQKHSAISPVVENASQCHQSSNMSRGRRRFFFCQEDEAETGVEGEDFFFFHSLDFCRNEKDGETSVKSVRTEQSQCEECKPHETGVLAVVKKTA